MSKDFRLKVNYKVTYTLCSMDIYTFLNFHYSCKLYSSLICKRLKVKIIQNNAWKKIKNDNVVSGFCSCCIFAVFFCLLKCFLPSASNGYRFLLPNTHKSRIFCFFRRHIFCQPFTSYLYSLLHFTDSEILFLTSNFRPKASRNSKVLLKLNMRF
jgi:hypothetical protein